MSAENKKSGGGMIVLILLGVAALLGGVQWLTLLIPVALLIWYSAGSMLRSGRN